MPVKIPSTLPATKILQNENIFVMDENRASMQDIRPLKIVILNLMPTKIVTETQLLRLIGNSPLQVEITLLMTETHNPKNTSKDHLESFYKTFDEIKDQKFDGMIITGAPVEHMDFEQVHYWEELKDIMYWSKTHVFNTMHICWAAQAALYYHYGINKYPLKSKMFGIYKHKVLNSKSKLLLGFDDEFYAPHSRHTSVNAKDIINCDKLELLTVSDIAGAHIFQSKNGKRIFITGHSEYDADTLALEYFRDKEKGKDIDIPYNYFPNDDPTQPPMVNWRANASMLFLNWLNYYVYQETPYDINTI